MISKARRTRQSFFLFILTKDENKRSLSQN
jgi:hypothetical protein